MSHTKEIWKPEESGMYILACDPDGNHGYVAVEIRGWGRLSKLGDDEAVKIQKDRARRIAALWNAAEELELTTEKIEEGEIQAIFSRNQERSRLMGVALERIGSLEAEKAVMLEVLEFANSRLICGDGDCYCMEFNLDEYLRILAAIRKAGGEE